MMKRYAVFLLQLISFFIETWPWYILQFLSFDWFTGHAYGPQIWQVYYVKGVKFFIKVHFFNHGYFFQPL